LLAAASVTTCTTFAAVTAEGENWSSCYQSAPGIFERNVSSTSADAASSSRRTVKSISSEGIAAIGPVTAVCSVATSASELPYKEVGTS
jgi:hypothetical protein